MFKRYLMLLILLVFVTSQAYAVDKKIAVLPFQINGNSQYSYLEKSAQSMFESRLSSSGKISVYSPKLNSPNSGEITIQSKATPILKKYGLDYLVWGTITISGDTASVETKLLNRLGVVSAFDKSGSINEVISMMETISNEMRAKLGLTVKKETSNITNKTTKTNPGFVYNTDSARSQIIEKYDRMDSKEGVWRSRTLNIAARAMVVSDLNNNGHNEVVLLEENKVTVYDYAGGNLKPITSYQFPSTTNALNLNAIDVNHDGKKEICISTIRDNNPEGYILTYSGRKLTFKGNPLPYFIGVINRPPNLSPVLIGQRKGTNWLFQKKIQEVVGESGAYSLRGSISLPEQANVLNCNFFQDNKGKILTAMSDNYDKIKVFSQDGSLLSQTDNSFAQTNIGISYFSGPMQFSQSSSMTESDAEVYYVAGRLISWRDSKGRPGLLVSQSFSTASEIFERYRNYAQSVVQNLYFDGVGLNTAWKTQRIKGSISDIAIADLNNDGKKELVVCVNTFPGAAGLKYRKTIIISYNLD